MTFSEFGRRIVSNGSNGTDHGAAAPVFVFGNKVKGGVLGNNPVIDSGMGYDDNLAFEFDYRQVYASVLEQWFDEGSGVINNTLNKSFDTLPIIGSSALLNVPNVPGSSLTVYPNPVIYRATIELQNNRSYTEIELMDLNGRPVQRIFRGVPSKPILQLEWNSTGLKQGQYVLVAKQKNNQQVVSVIKN